jgi:hypothetical protein
LQSEGNYYWWARYVSKVVGARVKVSSKQMRERENEGEAFFHLGRPILTIFGGSVGLDIMV